jgi:hypothetical protein
MALSEEEEFELLSLERERAGSQSPQAPSQSLPDALKASFQQTTKPIVSAATALQPKNLTGLLPTAGMMAGTAVAPGIGTAAGAGLGSIAQRMADLAYGQGAPPPTPGQSFAPKEAIWPVANTAMAGLPETPIGQAAGEKVGDVLSALKDKFVKTFPKVAQATTGKSAVKVARLIKDPTAILPESMGGAMSVDKASQQYGEALANDKTLIPLEDQKGFTRGIRKTEFSPFSRGQKEAEEKAQAIWDKWKAGEPINAQEAYDAKRATDQLWPTVVKERNAEQIRALSEFKTSMDDVLSSQGAGPFQKASKNYARARLGADFTQVLPRTKTGDISTVKSLILPLIEPRKLPFLAATSPLVTGIGNLGVQGAAKGINTIANNPAARQVLLQLLQKLKQNQSGQ